MLINQNQTSLYEIEDVNTQANVVETTVSNLYSFAQSGKIEELLEPACIFKEQIWEPIDYWNHNLISIVLKEDGYYLSINGILKRKIKDGNFRIGVYQSVLWIREETHISIYNEPEHLLMELYLENRFNCESLSYYDDAVIVFSGFLDEEECIYLYSLDSGSGKYYKRENSLWIHRSTCIA